jgi:hypothetical protein
MSCDLTGVSSCGPTLNVGLFASFSVEIFTSKEAQQRIREKEGWTQGTRKLAPAESALRHRLFKMNRTTQLGIIFDFSTAKTVWVECGGAACRMNRGYMPRFPLEGLKCKTKEYPGKFTGTL